MSVLPSLVTPLVDEEAAVGGTVADYAPPAAPAVEPVKSSPFVPDSAADTSLDGVFLQLLREPREPLTVTPPVSPMVADTSTPTEGPDSQRETLPIPSISPILPTGAVHADPGPDLSREGPFNAYDVVPDAGQSPVVMDSMTGCQYRMTSYEERVTDSDMNPSYGIHMHDPVLSNTWVHRSLPVLWDGHQNIGYSTWVVSARSRLRFVCIMTPVSS